ncbi:MAG: hypothetical protein IPM15_04675 [Betaproteobacteria bacterium]|nr:hypothetical protein [Betaproteobacteria bacterium]MCL4699906.1 hypothetical protein [Burkholderiaceae bacterium]
MATTYCKTSKGVTEIETRAFRLPPRLRSTLILLDGRRTLDELRTLVSQGLDENLQLLLEGGFIEAIATVEPRPAPRATAAPRPSAPEPAGADFLAVRREIVRLLNDQLGPVAESVAIKMERAANAAELRPLLNHAAQLIYQVRGASAAQAFRSRYMAE